MPRKSIAAQLRLGMYVLLASVVFSGLLALGSNIYLAGKADYQARVLAPLGTASMQVKQEVAEGKISLERLLLAREDASPERIWAHFNAAEAYLRAILEGGSTPKGEIVASNSEVVRAEAEGALQSLVVLRQLTQERMALLGNDDGPGSQADVEFDTLFDTILTGVEADSVAPAVADSAPAQKLIGEAKFLLTLGHLEVEEFLAGDIGEDWNNAVEKFAMAAERLRQADNAVPLPQLSDLLSQIERFAEVASTRLANGGAYLQEKVDVQERYSAAYRDFMRMADAVEADARAEIVSGMEEIQSVNLLSETASIVGIVIMTLMVFVGYRMMQRRIVRKLEDITGSMSQLARGNLNAALPDWNSADELGDLRETLSVFKSAFAEREQLEAEKRANLEKEQAQRVALAEAEKAEAAEAARQAREDSRLQEEKRKAEQATMAEIAAIVVAYADGDFSPVISTADKSGIFAELCAGLNRVGQSANAGLGAVRDALEKLSEGDLTHHMKTDLGGVFAEIAEVMDRTSRSLNQIVLNISESSFSVSNLSREIAGSADGLAKRTETNAGMLEQTSSSLIDMTQAVEKASKSAGSAQSAIEEISKKAEDGNRVVSNAVAAMAEIKDSSDAVGKILKVIDGIAFQTNLLALNAGVEAARAGDAGRGFAVVASEVRALAQRSSDAAREISDLMDRSRSTVSQGVKLVTDSGEVLEEIVQGIVDVAKQVTDIAAVASQTSQGIQKISTATRELERSTQQNAAVSEETSAAVQSLQMDAETLSEAVKSFRISNAAPQRNESEPIQFIRRAG